MCAGGILKSNNLKMLFRSQEAPRNFFPSFFDLGSRVFMMQLDDGRKRRRRRRRASECWGSNWPNFSARKLWQVKFPWRVSELFENFRCGCIELLLCVVASNRRMSLKRRQTFLATASEQKRCGGPRFYFAPNCACFDPFDSLLPLGIIFLCCQNWPRKWRALARHFVFAFFGRALPT